MAHFLLIEDEEIVADLLAQILELMGHTWTMAFDGQQGLEVLHAELATIDVILVNWSMPGMDGLEFLRRAANLIQGRIPCIFDSASSVERGRPELEAVTHVLQRPAEFSTYRRTFQHATQLRARYRTGLARASRTVWRKYFLDPSALPVTPAPWRCEAQSRDRPVDYVVDSPLTLVRTLASVTFDATGPRGAPRSRPARSELQFDSRHMDERHPELGTICREILAQSSGDSEEACQTAIDLFLHALASPPVVLDGGDEPSRTGIYAVSLEIGLRMVCRPALVVRRDDDGELHAEDGPALVYPDGFKVYAWHGSHVAPWMIEGEATYAPDDIHRHPNPEVRRMLRERYGESRYLVDVGATVIDVDSVPVDRTAPGGREITRALLEDDGSLRWLVASDGSTNRVYHMRVPQGCATCREAYEALSGRPGHRTIVEA